MGAQSTGWGTEKLHSPIQEHALVDYRYESGVE